MSKGTDEIKRTAVKAAAEAGKYALKRLNGNFGISHKSEYNDLVTEIDKKSEEMIINRIIDRYPGHSILAEESGEAVSGSDVKWVVDPLDGTVNFAHGFPFFCVSIGVYSGRRPIAGVVYAPWFDEIFTAIKGEGAFLNRKRIRVSSVKKLRGALMATGFAYDIKGKVSNLKYLKRVIERAQALRRAGSAAMDLCFVACGRLDGFWEMGLHPWDTAAGVIILKEAGGRTTGLDGKRFDVNMKEILSTNASIHSEVMRVLASG